MKKFNPTKSEKIVITIRLEEERVEEIDNIANKINISRNSFISQCLEFAINNLDFKNIKKKKRKK